VPQAVPRHVQKTPTGSGGGRVSFNFLTALVQLFTANRNSWKCLKCIRKPSTPDLSASKGLQEIRHSGGHSQKPLATSQVSHNAGFGSKPAVIVRSLTQINGYESILEPTRKKTTITRRPSLLHGDTVRHPKFDDFDTGEFLNLLQDDTLDSMLIELMQPKPKPPDLDVRRRRSEIPDTPDQRSSQLRIDSTVPTSSNLQAGISSSIQTKNDTTFVDEPSQHRINPKLTKLCQVCKTQLVLVANTSKTIRW
jgi:hypothetical protein